MNLAQRIRHSLAVYIIRFGNWIDYNVDASSNPSTVSQKVIVKKDIKKGRVVRTAAPKEYDFDTAMNKKGGRVLKIMPKQLQKIKEGQEMPRG